MFTRAPCWSRSSIRLRSPIWQERCKSVHPRVSFRLVPDCSLAARLPVGALYTGLKGAVCNSVALSAEWFPTRDPPQLLRLFWELLFLLESAVAIVANNGDREGSPVPIACSKVVLGLASAVMSKRSASCCLFIWTASHICLATVGPCRSTFSFFTNLFSTYCREENKG
jgi:hypothetical protein